MEVGGEVGRGRSFYSFGRSEQVDQEEEERGRRKGEGGR